VGCTGFGLAPSGQSCIIVDLAASTCVASGGDLAGWVDRVVCWRVELRGGVACAYYVRAGTEKETDGQTDTDTARSVATKHKVASGAVVVAAVSPAHRTACGSQRACVGSCGVREYTWGGTDETDRNRNRNRTTHIDTVDDRECRVATVPHRDRRPDRVSCAHTTCSLTQLSAVPSAECVCGDARQRRARPAFSFLDGTVGSDIPTFLSLSRFALRKQNS
jgi:hypothetical protein